ncbi:hypothetical protein ACROYT_G008353 [Oculina patagonica]
MESLDTPGPSLVIEDNTNSASFMPKNSEDELEEAKEDVPDHIEDPDGLEEPKETDLLDQNEDNARQKSKRPHTLTKKGLEYQCLIKEKDFQRALRRMKDKLHKLDMDWIDISDPHILRKERSDIEQFRQDLDRAQSEYVSLLTGDEIHRVVELSACLNKQVVELRMRIGEKIFQLEKEELCSRTSKRSSYSKKTASTRVSKGSASSQVSLLKMKALTELAKREVEMKFARIESEKRLEMERKRHEMEEIQKMKSYETAKAEVDAVTRLEDEGKEENPLRLAYMESPPKKIVEGYQFLKTDDAYTEAKKSLEKRFGHPSVVAEAFRRKLENWLKIPPRDGISLREFADFLKTLKEEKRRNFQRRTENRKSRHVNSLATQIKGPSDSMNGKKKACYWFGNASHELEMCQEFVKKPINERTQFIIRKGLCFRCLVHGHMAKENKCEKLLSCVRCKQKHPTCLHDNRRAAESTDRSNKATPEAAVKFTNAVDTENLQCSESDATANCTNICSIKGQQFGQDQSLIIPVWVSSGERPQNDVLTYALIDSQSNATTTPRS